MNDKDKIEIDQLIKEVKIINKSSREVQENVLVLSTKILELSESFMILGKALVPIVPPAARAEKLMANLLKELPNKQNKLKLVVNLDRSETLSKEYEDTKKIYTEAVSTLKRMEDSDNPALKKRIELQKIRVKKYESELSGVAAEAKLELELIKNEQESLIKANTVILLELQKKVFDQCSGTLQNFRNEWDNGKRYI